MSTFIPVGLLSWAPSAVATSYSIFISVGNWFGAPSWIFRPMICTHPRAIDSLSPLPGASCSSANTFQRMPALCLSCFTPKSLGSSSGSSI